MFSWSVEPSWNVVHVVLKLEEKSKLEEKVIKSIRLKKKLGKKKIYLLKPITQEVTEEGSEKPISNTECSRLQEVVEEETAL